MDSEIINVGMPEYICMFIHCTHADQLAITLPHSACISKFSSGQVSYYPDFHHKREVPRVKFEKDFR